MAISVDGDCCQMRLVSITRSRHYKWPDVASLIRQWSELSGGAFGLSVYYLQRKLIASVPLPLKTVHIHVVRVS